MANTAKYVAFVSDEYLHRYPRIFTDILSFAGGDIRIRVHPWETDTDISVNRRLQVFPRILSVNIHGCLVIVAFPNPARSNVSLHNLSNTTIQNSPGSVKRQVLTPS